MASVSAKAVFPVRVANPQVQVETPFRLNRRGRQVRALVILFVLVSGMFLAGQKVAHASSKDSFVSITVHQGESLWDIAQRVNPEQDPRDTIFELKAINHLADDQIVSGQSLLVPSH